MMAFVCFFIASLRTLTASKASKRPHPESKLRSNGLPKADSPRRRSAAMETAALAQSCASDVKEIHGVQRGRAIEAGSSGRAGKVRNSRSVLNMLALHQDNTIDTMIAISRDG